MHLESETAGFPLRAGTAARPCRAGSRRILPRLHRNRSGFDLRKIENVADQVQQVGAGAVDRAGEFDLLRRQVAVGVVAELLAEDENAVERRAQLVRHVGQEFGFVLRSEREFLGFFFQRAARLLDFLVLALDFDVLFGELLRFLRQLFVGLLQFFLLGSAARWPVAATASARPSVCIVASMLLSTMPMLAVSCSRNARCEAVKVLSEASSITAFTRSSKSTGSTITLRGTAWNKPERIGTVCSGRSVISMRRFSAAHWPDEAFAKLASAADGRSCRRRRTPRAARGLRIPRLPSDRSRLAAR